MRKNTRDTYNAWRENRSYKRGGSSIWTDGQTIYSYSTPIIQRQNSRITFNASRYSTTTSTHQNALRYLLSCTGLVVEEYDANS